MSANLTYSDRQTVPYCWNGNEEGLVSKLSSFLLTIKSKLIGCRQNKDVNLLGCCWLVDCIHLDTWDSDCHAPQTSKEQPCTVYNEWLATSAALQHRMDMIARWQTKCDLGSGILHSLQRADGWFRQPIENCTAVVKSTKDESWH